MWKYLSFTGILTLLLAGAWIQWRQDALATDTEMEASITEAMEFERMKKADPATGEIPADAVLSAWRELRDRGYFRNNHSSYRSGDGWQLVNDFFPSLAVTKITYDPFNTNVFYFCTGEGWFNADAVRGAGVFKSEDAGATWTQLPSTDNSNFYYCQDIDVHPLTGDVYVATRTAGLQRSSDGGNTWQKVLGAGAGSARNSICDVEITSDGGVFVGVGIFETDGIYYSDNGDSATFAKQTTGLPAGGYYRIELAVSPSDPDIAYAVPCSTDFRIQGIYRTDNRGLNWQATNLPGDNREFAARQAWYDLVMEVDPTDPNVVVAGGLNFWRTRDGGGTWQQITSGRLDSVLIRYVHVDQHAIVFRSADEVYFGNDGGIYKSTNFTDDIPVIYARNDGYNVTQYYSVAMAPAAGDHRLIGGTQDNGSHLANNSGLSSFKPVSGADGGFAAFHSEEDDIFFTTTQFERIFRFNNGGYELPDTITNKNIDSDNLLFINPIEIDPVNPEYMYQASNVGLWRIDSASTTDSTGWEKACVLGGTISAIGVSTEPPGLVFIGRYTANTEIFLLADAANVDNTSTPFGLDPDNQIPDGGFGGSIYCSSISVDVNDANHLLVSYNNYGVISLWETKDALSGSPTWTAVEGDLPNIPVNWAVLHPDQPQVAYIATELGVFYTDLLDGDNTEWKPCSNFPVVRTDMIRIRPADGAIVAATHGRGMWEATLDASGSNNDITWYERGPTNVGGRTRAIMIDPNDPTGKTIWSGSVSGGLWKTTDIDGITQVAHQGAASGVKLYPNPVNGSTFFADLQPFLGQRIQTTIISMATGQVVAVLPAVTVAGNGTVPFRMQQDLPPGQYMVQFRSATLQSVAKMLVL